MANSPLVSAITIFLNEERFLVEAVESVLSQTYSNWELILVDDGSSDGSVEIAQDYVTRDPRIRYVTHPEHANRGMSASRNRGFFVSSGQYVAFLDADDAWLPEKLEEQVEIMERCPDVDLAYGRTEWWYSWTGDPGDVDRDYLFDPGVPLHSILEPPALLPSLIRPDGNPPYTCSAIVRRSAYARIGGFETSFRGLFEDQAFFAKAFLELTVFVSSARWDRYRQHEASTCSIGLRSGDLHPVDLSPSRGVFLDWLDGYLRRRRFRDPAILSLLATELEPYRYAAAPAIVDAVALLGKGSPELLGCGLEFPEVGAQTAGRVVHVLGWAVGAGSRVREVVLSTQGRLLARTTVDLRRPDVAAALPDVEHAGTSGFRSAFSLVGMSRMLVDATCVLEDGRRVPLATFEARRRFRGRDSEAGLPLVSVIMEAGPGTSEALAGVMQQTYPRIEPVVVDDGDPSDRQSVRRIAPAVRFVRRDDSPWKAAGLNIATGALIVFLEAGATLDPDAVAAGLAALNGEPHATHANGHDALDQESAAATIYHRFALIRQDGGVDGRSVESTRFPPAATGAEHGGVSTLILMYHRVSAPGVDPWGLAVSPEQFAAHVELLTQYSTVPLRDIDRLNGQSRRIVITFDDGYADNLAAARVLQRQGLPATFFIVAGALGRESEFWWDELERILFEEPHLPESIDIDIDRESVTLALGVEATPAPWRASDGPVTARQLAYAELYRRLDALDHARRDQALAELARITTSDHPPRAAFRPLTCEELVELASIEGMEIGAHTVTHPRLSALSADVQRDEVLGSRNRLEEIVSGSVESFAYPHGTRADYTPTTVAIVAEAGFSRACTAEGGSFGASASQLELPRLMVENWDVDELERRMHEAFATVAIEPRTSWVRRA